MLVCQNHGVRSGLFFSQLENRDVFVSCTVRNNAVELTVSAFLELNDVDMSAIEASCRENQAFVSLNVSENGVVASVKESALLLSELDKNKELAVSLFHQCCTVMLAIVPEGEDNQ